MPQLTSFRKRGSLFNLYYTNQSASINDGKIRLAKGLIIPIPQWNKYKERIQNFQQVRILPSGKKLKVEIVYRYENKEADLDKSRYASIDLEIGNIATMITDKGSFLYSGKFLKSYNKNFNRRLARLQSIKDKQGIKRATKQMQGIYEKRDRYFEDAFHKYSRMDGYTDCHIRIFNLSSIFIIEQHYYMDYRIILR